jgi:hypothetical protein
VGKEGSHAHIDYLTYLRRDLGRRLQAVSDDRYRLHNRAENIEHRDSAIEAAHADRWSGEYKSVSAEIDRRGRRRMRAKERGEGAQNVRAQGKVLGASFTAPVPTLTASTVSPCGYGTCGELIAGRSRQAASEANRRALQSKRAVRMAYTLEMIELNRTKSCMNHSRH